MDLSPSQYRRSFPFSILYTLYPRSPRAFRSSLAGVLESSRSPVTSISHAGAHLSRSLPAPLTTCSSWPSTSHLMKRMSFDECSNKLPVEEVQPAACTPSGYFAQSTVLGLALGTQHMSDRKMPFKAECRIVRTFFKTDLPFKRMTSAESEGRLRQSHNKAMFAATI